MAKRLWVVFITLGLFLLPGCLRQSSPNESPVAEFTFEPTAGYAPLVVTFDASSSFDPDGEIVSYIWDFGDGTTGGGVVVEHIYPVPGEYTVRLTVRDDKGAEDSAEGMVEALEPPEEAIPPVARFTYSPPTPKVGESVTFDASSSSDDGEIVEYRWNFGDGTFGRGKIVSHVYYQVGTYTVRLTVYDDEGLAGQATQAVVVSAAPNQPPVARFTYSPENPTAGLPITFDASSSADPDGTIVSYAWDFGNGQQGSGAVVRHTYYQPGRYTVRLAVTDDRGGTAGAEAQVTVGPPTPPPPPG